MAEDPELERRLEAMFSSARPRRGFEDELWRRIEARRPWYRRFGLGFQPALRYAPALATILVVALGVTWLATSFHPGGGNSASTTSAGAPGYAGNANSATGAPAFGVLPSVASHAPGLKNASQGADSNASRNFSGTLPVLPASLPVYRYDEPSTAQRTAAAATLKARSGLSVAVTPSDPAQRLEPQLTVSGPPAGGPAPACPTNHCALAFQASAFLSDHSLRPAFTFQVEFPASGGQVVYGRQFDGPAGPVRQVRSDGTPAGLTVDVGGGTVTVRGPLDLPLTSAPYPLRSASAAIAAVEAPTVTGAAAFDKAELVYLLVVSGAHGYYEPALLLTGPGGYRLAPVIAAEWMGA